MTLGARSPLTMGCPLLGPGLPPGGLCLAFVLVCPLLLLAGPAPLYSSDGAAPWRA